MIAGLIFKVCFGIILGIGIVADSWRFLIYLLRNAVALGLKDLDATLIKSPVLRPDLRELVSQGDILSPGHPAHVSRHGE
jgi:hypothetical protein